MERKLNDSDLDSRLTDATRMETSAYRDGDEWVINGAKRWNTGMHAATHDYVFARTSGNPGEGYYGITGPNYANRIIGSLTDLYAQSGDPNDLPHVLMAAADDLHRSGGLLERYGQFPSPEYLDLPHSEEAERYFESGPTFLRRVLPFWAASLAERLMVMLVPLLALLIPLLRIMPPVYRWRIRYRIYRWYRELLTIDPLVREQDAAPPADPAAGLRALERIEEEVAKVHVPLSYADQLYTLRMHMELVRERLEAEAAKPPA